MIDSGGVEGTVARQADLPQHPQCCLVILGLQALRSKDQDLGMNLAVGSGTTHDKSSPRRSTGASWGASAASWGPSQLSGKLRYSFRNSCSLIQSLELSNWSFGSVLQR